MESGGPSSDWDTGGRSPGAQPLPVGMLRSEVCFCLSFVPLLWEPAPGGGELTQVLLTCHHPPSPTGWWLGERERERNQRAT